MAFIEYWPRDQIPAVDRVPDEDNILRIHGVHPPVMRQHFELYVQLMHRPGPLSRARREMIAVLVSTVNQCHY